MPAWLEAIFFGTDRKGSLSLYIKDYIRLLTLLPLLALFTHLLCKKAIMLTFNMAILLYGLRSKMLDLFHVSLSFLL